MPIHDFTCENIECSQYHYIIEKLVKLEEIVFCAVCKDTLRKMVSKVSPAVFKGPGFYATTEGKKL